MAKIIMEVIKEAELTNNCPECFNQELKLSFYQKHSHGKFVHKVTNEVSSEIKCKKCFTLIYPVTWTPDIERVFEYYQKTAIPQKSATKYTSLFYILVLIAIFIIAAGFYIVLNKENLF
ncbi:hypothetical protein H0I23_12495 [Cellulophaga sp. HaHaR_3_176]|uniref:hypothetical protein n=1 Tax=Cellulophaga sp. HaHaR_3_176 TaxID=1942464 RepID=UPI001C1F3E3B|nr:hypothetical protein [Cellulophaga sp. HaHaR_3_176]QWX83266.1 hypothetical protein H0I23_12495 [Cellulophaga sp. HaHaR_3_176]